jgi:hypothetical protein
MNKDRSSTGVAASPSSVESWDQSGISPQSPSETLDTNITPQMLLAEMRKNSLYQDPVTLEGLPSEPVNLSAKPGAIDPSGAIERPKSRKTLIVNVPPETSAPTSTVSVQAAPPPRASSRSGSSFGMYSPKLPSVAEQLEYDSSDSEALGSRNRRCSSAQSLLDMLDECPGPIFVNDGAVADEHGTSLGFSADTVDQVKLSPKVNTRHRLSFGK